MATALSTDARFATICEVATVAINVVASWRADGQIYALRLMTGPHFSFYPKFSKEQLPAYFLLLSLLFHRDFEPQFFCFVFALT